MLSLSALNRRTLLLLPIFAGLAIVFWILDLVLSDVALMPCNWTLFRIIAIIFAILSAGALASLLTQLFFASRSRPIAEALMVGRIYNIIVVFCAALAGVYAFGQIGAFMGFMATFGGMLLGWSLQAPVSGFAAYILVSLKRPIRPGDRIQFPSLGLVGDVQDIGAMYTVLDQVGGTIGSEEAVGRYILVPNAMLFSQVVINYTVRQDAAYMLDEVVVRITYDSNWESAEKVLLDAAIDITGDIIIATKCKPYIRSDLYDYGVYLRLRYQTAVKDRAEIAYKLTKRIFEKMQRSTDVDLAIPFIYSYRAGADKKEDDAVEAGRSTKKKPAGPYPAIHEILVETIQDPGPEFDLKGLDELTARIQEQGLLQPLVLLKNPKSERYEILAGHLRFVACKRLGWKSVPAVVKEVGGPRD